MKKLLTTLFAIVLAISSTLLFACTPSTTSESLESSASSERLESQESVETPANLTFYAPDGAPALSIAKFIKDIASAFVFLFPIYGINLLLNIDTSVAFIVVCAASVVPLVELNTLRPTAINKIAINTLPAINKAFDAFSIKISSIYYIIYKVNQKRVLLC